MVFHDITIDGAGLEIGPETLDSMGFVQTRDSLQLQDGSRRLHFNVKALLAKTSCIGLVIYGHWLVAVDYWVQEQLMIRILAFLLLYMQVDSLHLTSYKNYHP